MKNVHVIEMKVEGKDWENCLDKAFKKKNKEIKVDGFRKGACPKDIYIKKMGIESLYMDAIDAATEIAYEKAMKDNKELVPVIQPTLDVKKLMKRKLALNLHLLQNQKLN